MKCTSTIVWLLAQVFFVTIVSAGVVEKNGNFYISYTDLIINGPLKIVRTYNSKATAVGLFGFGWGSALDTHLVVSPSGIPVIRHNGSGWTEYFEPLKTDERYDVLLKASLKTLEKMLSNEKLAQKGDINAKERQRIRNEVLKKLKQDREYRFTSWERFLRKGMVESLEVPVGTEFRNTCNCSYNNRRLVRLIDGYLFTAKNDGHAEFFNLSGQLMSFTDTQGLEMKIERDETGPQKGRIRSARLDDDVVYFFYNESGQVDRIFHPQSGDTVLYRYKSSNLIYSRDVADNIFRYAYDDKHNMTKISYIDDSEMRISYEDKTSYVSEIVNRDGTKRNYEYGDLDDDPNLNYYTEIVRTPPPEKDDMPRRERREYRICKNERGDTWVCREASEADGIRREFTFDDQEVLKRIVETSKYTPVPTITDFTFDGKGRVERVKSGGWSRMFDYADESSTRIKKLTTRYGVEQSAYAFEYDGYDRLITARYEGTTVRITYQIGSKPIIAKLQNDEHKLRVIRDTKDRVVRLDLEGIDEIGSLALNSSESGKSKIKNDDYTMSYRISGILSGMMAICAPAQANFNLEIP